MPRTEEDLRTALRSPVDPAAVARLTGVVRHLGDGGRPEVNVHPNRRRTAWMAVAAACVAVLAVAIGVSLTRGSGGHLDKQAPAASQPSVATPSPPPATSSAPRIVRAVYGDVVRTSVPFGSGTLALWMRQQGNGALVLYGGRLRSGRPTLVFDQSYVRPTSGYQCGWPAAFPRGFQCGYDAAGLVGDRHAWLILGYVVGDVASVDLTVNGRPYEARTAVWSVDERVHIYWLAGSTAKPKSPTPAGVTAMIARNSAGKIVAKAAGAIAHG